MTEFFLFYVCMCVGLHMCVHKYAHMDSYFFKVFPHYFSFCFLLPATYERPSSFKLLPVLKNSSISVDIFTL